MPQLLLAVNLMFTPHLNSSSCSGVCRPENEQISFSFQFQYFNFSISVTAFLLHCLKLPEAKTWHGELQTLAWKVMWAQLFKDNFPFFFF